MPVQAIQAVQQGKKGGGGLGKLLGTIGGAIAGVATGGLALPAIAAGAGLGSMAGEAAGGLINKATPETQQQGAPAETENAMSRKLRSGDQMAQIAQLKDSAMATAELPPDQRAQYLDPIMQAAAKLSKGQV